MSKLWENPQVDLSPTSLNTKLPLYVSPIPDPQAWVVDVLNIPWKNLDAYAFPPTALLPKVVQKLLSHICRIFPIAPGWLTKPWFWDLVEMSSGHSKTATTHLHSTETATEQQIPCQPSFPQFLCVVSIGVQLSKNVGSLQRWQKELLLLKDSEPEASTPQNGRTFKDNAPRNRWTSGIHL